MMKLGLTMTVRVRRIVLFSMVAAGLSAAMGGCGSMRREQRPEWRNQAELACMKSGKVRETPYARISKSIDGPGICGANYPMKVSALATPVARDVAQNGNLILTSGNLMLTSITPTATLSCPMVAGVDAWLGGEVQKAAMAWFGQPVIELITFGSFACRPMNHRSGARLSEHSFANAIDAKAFKLADGRVVSVVKGWKGYPDEQGFLREVAIGACTHFTTVLAPGSDAMHYDHIHIDMARHNGGRHVCRPALQMPDPQRMLVPQVAQQGSAVFKPVPTATAAFAPSVRGAVRDSADDDGEVEDLRNEPNFNGKDFDITGAVPGPNDPQVVIQRPAPAKRLPRRLPQPSPFSPAPFDPASR